MKYIDQHMHSEFSFDCKVPLEEYLKSTDNRIVTTEHLDLGDPAYDFKDRPLDLDGYARKVDALNEKYNQRLLKGIEVGWNPLQKARILEILDSVDFDLVLMSVHNNGQYDYMDKKADLETNPARLVPQYLDNLLSGLEEMYPYVQVLAHFDYGFRVTKISKNDLETYGKERLIKLFEFMIKHDISFELNTSSMIRHENIYLYAYAISLYVQCGGTNFTMGSDSHYLETYQREFDRVLQFIDGLGVEELTYYIKKQAHKVSVKELLKTASL